MDARILDTAELESDVHFAGGCFLQPEGPATMYSMAFANLTGSDSLQAQRVPCLAEVLESPPPFPSWLVSLLAVTSLRAILKETWMATSPPTIQLALARLHSEVVAALLMVEEVVLRMAQAVLLPLAMLTGCCPLQTHFVDGMDC
jgi:hypothetical protein